METSHWLFMHQIICCKLFANETEALCWLKTLILVYNSIVYSYLQYSIINWGRAYSTALQPLNMLHKKILKIMNFCDFTAPFKPLFYKCNTLKICDIYTLEVAKLIHNCLSNKTPDSLSNFFYYKTKYTIIQQDPHQLKMYLYHV